MHIISRLSCTMVIAALLLVPAASSAQIDLSQYVQVYEVRDSNTTPTTKLSREIDLQNSILIKFDRERLHEVLLRETEVQNAVRIRVEASVQRGDGAPRPIEVDNFVTVTNTDGLNYAYHDKVVQVLDHATQRVSGSLPDSLISLFRLGVTSGDRLYLKITDVRTQREYAGRAAASASPVLASVGRVGGSVATREWSIQD